MRIIVSFILFCLCLHVFSGNYRFETLNTSDGLSQNTVLCIHQDSEGFMWFGTIDGLNRWDGYEFKVYRASSEEANSIGGNQITSITEDSYKNLWISTINNGISRFNLITEEFTHIKNTPEQPDLILQNHAGDIYCDSEDNIWINSKIGITYIKQHSAKDYDILKFTQDKDNPQSLFHLSMLDFYEDESGNFWVTTGMSIDLLKDTLKGEAKNNFHHLFVGGNEYGFHKIVEVPEGFVVSTETGLRLFKLNEEYPEKTTLTFIDKNISSILIRDQKGDLWAGGNTGLIKYEHNPGEEVPYSPTNFFTIGIDSRSLPNANVRSLFVDNAGVLWVGTNGGGVCKYSPSRTKFRHYYHTDEKGSISENILMGIYEDSKKNVWVCTEGNGLNRLPFAKEKMYWTGFEEISVNQKGNQNFAFYLEELNSPNYPTFLVGVGYPNRLVQITLKNKQWAVEQFTPEAASHAMGLTQDENGNLWVGTYYDGIAKYIPTINGYEKIEYTLNNSILETNTIRFFKEDTKGRLWIGTAQGLVLLTKEQKNLKKLEGKLFQSDPKDSLSLSHNYIVPIIETSPGDIYIGTFGGGLNKYIEGDKDTNGYFEHLTVKDGLPNNHIKQIVEDKNQNLWISSNRGISYLDTKSKKIINYDMYDGLQGMEFSDLSGCMLHDGELLFGGANGINAFYPEEIELDTTPPIVVLTELILSNKAVRVNETINKNVILTRSLNSTNQIVLRHPIRGFDIYFSALHFAVPQSNQFKYQLEGFDEAWIPTPSKIRFARYTNMKYGTYTFKVTASNSDGVWNKQPRELTVVIKPPFWLTLWFKWSVGIVIVLLISIIIQFRFYLIKKQNAHLESEVKRRTAEITKKNSELHRQAEILNETNILLEERQQEIEEQSEELLVQKETLIEQAEELLMQKDNLLEKSQILENQKLKLEESNRTKDKFYSILAHDLKGPFNTLLGYLQLLNQKIDTYDKKRLKSRFQHSLNSAEILYKLVQNLLEWSRAQRGLTPFNPVEIIIEPTLDEILDIYSQTMIEKQLSYSKKISGEVKFIGDINMFNGIIRNLISNAIKYSKPGGAILVEATVSKEVAQFMIKDNGIGIPKEYIDQIFRVDSNFSQVGTNNEEGTGLGLVLCKDFVEKHKGKIWVESEAGKGTAFFFTFPQK